MMFLILYKDGLSDISQLKTSILEDFEITEQNIEESVLDQIIKCSLKFQKEKLNIQKETNYNEGFNILLLGQRGCGKATFINAFINYMNYVDVERLCLKYI